jgi:hypothetical protein
MSREDEALPFREVYAPGFDRPALCVAGKTGPWPWTSCVVLVGYVEVIGHAKAVPGTPAQRGNDANAVAGAVAGVAHLERMVGRGLED